MTHDLIHNPAATGNSLELSDEHVRRIDEMDNAAFDFIKVLTENPNTAWDMAVIGELIDCAVSILTNAGFRIRYPAVVYCHDGTKYIEEYSEEV